MMNKQIANRLLQPWKGMVLLLLGAIALFLSPFRVWLESSMTSHILIEFPLLVAVGYIFGLMISNRLPKFITAMNAGGIAGILLCTFCLSFWMIPRWLDESLLSSTVAMAKYASLILLVGIPLALSWDRMHSITRGVVKIEFLSMLFRLGWLYLISPERFCNNYLLGDQALLGQGMLVLGLTLSLTWLIPLFIDQRETNAKYDNLREIKHSSLP